MTPPTAKRPFWKLHVSTMITVVTLAAIFIWLNVRPVSIKQGNGGELIVCGTGWPAANEKTLPASSVAESSSEQLGKLVAMDRAMLMFNIIVGTFLIFALALNVEMANRRFAGESHEVKTRDRKNSETMPLFWFVIISIIVFIGNTFERIVAKLRHRGRDPKP